MSHTVVSGTDLLLVIVFYDTFFDVIPVVTWNGLPMTHIHGRQGGARLGVYQIESPPTGTGNVVAVCSDVHGTTVSGAAVNFGNFGQIRYAEYTWLFSFDSPSTYFKTAIYADASDLVLSFICPYTDFNTATPDPGQTLLASSVGVDGGAQFGGCQIAVSQVNTPIEAGGPIVPANYTEAGWTTSVQGFSTVNTQFLIAIRGLETEPPPGSSIYIGRVTDFLSFDSQTSNMRRWRHEVPTSYPTLVVLETLFDAVVAGIWWQADGQAEVALTELVQSNAAGVWVLEDAPTGVGWIRIQLTFPRWIGATAFSISGTDLVGDVFRGGIDPQFVDIATAPGQLVADRIGQQSDTLVTQFGLPTGGHSFLSAQGVFGSANGGLAGGFGRTSTNGSNQGSASWATAAGLSTVMSWTGVTGTYSQAAFAFTGVPPPPPPPPGGEGCPDTLPILPVTIVGCPDQIGPAVASVVGCVGILGPTAV